MGAMVCMFNWVNMVNIANMVDMADMINMVKGTNYLAKLFDLT